MGKTPVTDPHKAWNVKHFKRLEAYNARLQKLLDNAIGKAAMIAMRHGAEASIDHLFSFSDDRQMKAEADKLMKELSDEMTSFIKSAEEAEWKKAYEQAASYIGALYKAVADIKGLEERSAEAFLTMRTRNLDALEAFRKRKIGGLSLSKKVWNYTQDFGRQMEVSIDTALMQGKSAAALSRDIRSLLTDPNALFRRVRDENDQLRMSKAMEAYHPGTGRYRSAYQNAMRLARTEINMAYRASDCDTAQQSDDCVGIEVHLSNNHNCKGVPKGEFYDICDQLAGKYPKGFNFVGWHPQCHCFITYVLKTDEEHRRDIMTDTNGDSVNTVKDVPDSFKQWVKDNGQRIKASEQKGTLPYFLKDNEKYWKDVEKDLNTDGLGNAKDDPKAYRCVCNDSSVRMKPTGKKDVSAIADEVGRIANVYPEYFSKGFAGIEAVSVESSYMSTIGGKITVNFAEDANGFNAGESLLSAFGKIGKGQEMSKDEEYSVEVLWHEILHNKSRNKTVLPPIEAVDVGFKRVVAETVNQLVARHTYGELLSQLGGKARHSGWILENGYGYGSLVSNLRKILVKADIDEAEFVSKANAILMQDYADIDLKIGRLLKSMYKGGGNIEWVFGMIEIDGFENYLEILH